MFIYLFLIVIICKKKNTYIYIVLSLGYAELPEGEEGRRVLPVHRRPHEFLLRARPGRLRAQHEGRGPGRGRRRVRGREEHARRRVHLRPLPLHPTHL